MKRKIIAMLLVVALAGVLAGCGNMSLGPGNFTYEKVHVDTHNYSGCFTIEKWYDNETGIEVKTEEAGSMFPSEGTYILLSGDAACPLCASMEG